LNAIHTKRGPMGCAEDGLRALYLVEAAYHSTQSQEWVGVPQAARTVGSEQ
jgi:hypothetical protein